VSHPLLQPAHFAAIAHNRDPKVIEASAYQPFFQVPEEPHPLLRRDSADESEPQRSIVNRSVFAVELFAVHAPRHQEGGLFEHLLKPCGLGLGGRQRHFREVVKPQ
jgi:hypothetical protein